MEKYEYKVDEKSLTQNFLIRFIWTPILHRLPSNLKPNTITIVGFFFMIISGASILLVLKGSRWPLLLAAFSLFVYTACDNVDGMHARRTKQSSKLGEFLDHWFDSFSCIIANIAMALTLGLDDRILTIYAISIGIAFFCTIWEHHHTGVFHSGTMGTNEGLLTIISLYLILFIFDRPSWLTYDGTYSNPVFIVITLTIVVGFYTAISCIVRVKKHLAECFLLFAVMLTIGAWDYYDYINSVSAAILILATNTVFSGKLITEHLLEREKFYRHYIVIIFFICGVLLVLLPQISSFNISKEYYTYTFYTASFLLAATLLIDGFYGIYNLKNVK